MSQRYIAYRLLCFVFMLLCLALGAALIREFFVTLLLPQGMAGAGPMVPTNYWGLYMMGFAGTLMIIWGFFQIPAIRSPVAFRAIGAVTAFGLVLNALFRIVAWLSGEYAEVGNLPRFEAAIFLILALAFIWLRPPKHPVEAEATAPSEDPVLSFRE